MPIRRMTEADAAVVADLASQLGYPASAAAIVRRLRRIAAAPDHALFVAEAGDGAVVGWVHVHLSWLLAAEPVAEVWGLVVDGRHRGEGIGRRLLATAEAWAMAEGYGTLRLRSNAVRHGAHAFYERLGYRVVKTSLAFEKTLSATTGMGDKPDQEP